MTEAKCLFFDNTEETCDLPSLRSEVELCVSSVCQAVVILKEHFVFFQLEGPCVSLLIPLGCVSNSAQLCLTISTRQTHLFQHLNEISMLGCKPEKKNAFIRCSEILLTVSKSTCLFFPHSGSSVRFDRCVEQLKGTLSQGHLHQALQ